MEGDEQDKPSIGSKDKHRFKQVVALMDSIIERRQRLSGCGRGDRPPEAWAFPKPRQAIGRHANPRQARPVFLLPEQGPIQLAVNIPLQSRLLHTFM